MIQPKHLDAVKGLLSSFMFQAKGRLRRVDSFLIVRTEAKQKALELGIPCTPCTCGQGVVFC